MDRIFLEGIEVHCRVGCAAEERRIAQALRVDVGMSCPGLAEAAERERVDAVRLAGELVAVVQAEEYPTIERVAEAIARGALRHPLVDKVEVTVRARLTESGPGFVGVQIGRRRPEER